MIGTLPGVRTTSAMKVRGAVRDATLAASVHNCQPWRFVVGSGSVEIWLEDGPRPTVIDPLGRWAMASLGAAAANLELGLRRRLEREVRIEPLSGACVGAADGRRGRGVAVPSGPAHRPVVVANWGRDHVPATARERELHAAVGARRTARTPLYGELDPQVWKSLAAAVRGRGSVDFVEAAPGNGTALAVGARALRPDAVRTAELLALTAEVDARWCDDPAYLAEIARWAKVSGGRGIPTGAYGRRDASGRVAGRDFSVRLDGPPDRLVDDYFEIMPQLLVVVTVGDSPGEQVLAGAAVQRAMLAATAAGLGIGVLGQLVEDADARRRASDALGLGGGVVQQVLRLGRPAADDPRPARTPRRSVRRVVS